MAYRHGNNTAYIISSEKVRSYQFNYLYPYRVEVCMDLSMRSICRDLMYLEAPLSAKEHIFSTPARHRLG
jgi:hypothetical protein